MFKLFLILFILFLCSCKTVPGIEEPTFWICDIVNVDLAKCYNVTDPTKETIDMKLNDMIGYSCLNPRAFAAVDQHHTALHLKIEELMGGSSCLEDGKK